MSWMRDSGIRLGTRGWQQRDSDTEVADRWLGAVARSERSPQGKAQRGPARSGSGGKNPRDVLGQEDGAGQGLLHGHVGMWG